MSNVLIVAGHPDPKGSIANKEIVAKLAEQLPGSVVDDLGTLYPDYRIDVAAEQAKLEAADVVVLDFPVYWYAMPSLLQKWVEDVFTYGWAYGSTGDKLHGKKLVVSLTAGAPGELYTREGALGHTIEDFFPSTLCTAGLTGLEFKGFVFTGGLGHQAGNEDDLRAKADEHAERVLTLVKGL